MLNSFAQNEKDYSLSRAQKITGKYVFMYSEPIEKYEIVFDIQVIFTWSSLNTTTKIADAVYRAANRKSKRKGLEYDAIIIGSTSKDIAIKFIE